MNTPESQRIQWTRPLLSLDDSTNVVISVIETVHNNLRNTCSGGYEHVDLQQHQALSVREDISEFAKSNKATVPSLLKDRLLLTYMMADPIRLLDLFVNSKRITVVQLLDAACEALAASNFLACFILFRSVLEQIATFHYAQEQLHKDFSKDLANCQLPDDIIVQAQLWTVPTRFLIAARPQQ